MLSQERVGFGSLSLQRVEELHIEVFGEVFDSVDVGVDPILKGLSVPTDGVPCAIEAVVAAVIAVCVGRCGPTRDNANLADDPGG
jgi:hypothetical protein